MLFATFLGLLLIPVFYVVVRRLLGDTLEGPSKPPGTSSRAGTLRPRTSFVVPARRESSACPAPTGARPLPSSESRAL